MNAAKQRNTAGRIRGYNATSAPLTPLVAHPRSMPNVDHLDPTLVTSMSSPARTACQCPDHTPTRNLGMSQATGWAAVERALTDFDQKEVDGYKDDIDTLLVFVS